MDYVYESQPAIIGQDKRLLAKILVVGAVLGAVICVISHVLWRFVLSDIVCTAGQSICVEANSYAGNIALVLGAIIGVISLVKIGVYRPVIISLGATICLWGIGGWLFGRSTIIFAIAIIILYTLSYALFAWISRIRKAPVMLITFIIITILARIIPMSF